MPIIIPKDIPAFSILKQENIFVMARARAITQDIRPIEIAIVNLMPTKVETETQLLRLLSNSPLQINVTFVNTATHESKNTSKSHLDRFYKTFDEIKNNKFDGMIITGAPVESMPFEQVDYWAELTQIFDFAEKNVTSTIFICWGAQAGLYYHYGVQKYPLSEKLFGIFAHNKCVIDPLLKGIDDTFYIPHSRHTKVLDEDIKSCKDLQTLAYSSETGCAIIKSLDNKKIFFTGHSEYDRETLKTEYLRDKNKGLDIKPPKDYFINNSLDNIDMKWISTANLLYTNWLNYYVYQVTPFEL